MEARDRRAGAAARIPDPERPYRPHDDRIVGLALHRALDESLGHNVVITAWWRAV
ncbi:hypothetical protein ABZZ36_11355 [Actinacidiphila glaucinigra]|uniref:hypothetical protein n=1 Tax=Actinacidiphila glaucinigra TaxID=235986 RepID=UPI0033A2D436